MARILNGLITVYLLKSIQMSKEKKLFCIYVVLKGAISLTASSGNGLFQSKKQK